MQRAYRQMQEAESSFRPLTAADRNAARPWKLKTVAYPPRRLPGISAAVAVDEQCGATVAAAERGLRRRGRETGAVGEGGGVKPEKRTQRGSSAELLLFPAVANLFRRGQMENCPTQFGAYAGEHFPQP